MTGDERPAIRVSTLFDPEPQTWGLRGDPYLWRALRAHLAGQDIPASPGDLVGILHEAFRELVGTDLASDPRHLRVPGAVRPRRHVQRNDQPRHLAPAADAHARRAGQSATDYLTEEDRPGSRDPADGSSLPGVQDHSRLTTRIIGRGR